MPLSSGGKGSVRAQMKPKRQPYSVGRSLDGQPDASPQKAHVQPLRLELPRTQDFRRGPLGEPARGGEPQ
jgi:hypothetical protein